jgi:hypothetical protein
MPRASRYLLGGMVFHVLNRAVGRRRLFRTDDDYLAFERDKALLAAWPLPRKAGWVDYVNTLLKETELAAMRKSVQRGSPFGDGEWSDRTARRLGLESTIRPRGRPKRTT